MIKKILVAAMALVGLSAASAHADSFSLSFGGPAYVPAYAPAYAPAPVYAAPAYYPPTYYQPAYYQPAPVYRPAYVPYGGYGYNNGFYGSGFRIGYNDYDRGYRGGYRGGRGGNGGYHGGWRDGNRGHGNFYRTAAPFYGRPEGRGGQWHGGQR